LKFDFKASLSLAVIESPAFCAVLLLLLRFCERSMAHKGK